MEPLVVFILEIKKCFTCFRKAFYFMVCVGSEVEYGWSMANALCFGSLVVNTFKLQVLD